MSCDHLCEDCQKKRQIKYTEVEDINNLINEFSGNITGGNRQTQMYMDIYDFYYDYIGELLFDKFSNKSKDSEEILEWLFDQDLLGEGFENIDDHKIMINIYNEYIPVDCHGFNLFGEYVREAIIEKIHEEYCHLESGIMVEVFYDIKELFSSRVKNKTFFKFFTSLSKE
jgi:hypothetical protein